jgi:hypothetical protein
MSQFVLMDSLSFQKRLVEESAERRGLVKSNHTIVGLYLFE